jgi:hypothetical protein
VPDLKALAEAGALGTLKKIKFDGETGGIVQSSLRPLAALNLLAKMHGIAPDQTNVTFTTPQQQALGRCCATRPRWRWRGSSRSG